MGAYPRPFSFIHPSSHQLPLRSDTVGFSIHSLMSKMPTQSAKLICVLSNFFSSIPPLVLYQLYFFYSNFLPHFKSCPNYSPIVFFSRRDFFKRRSITQSVLNHCPSSFINDLAFSATFAQPPRFTSFQFYLFLILIHVSRTLTSHQGQHR